ncbi:hypothetical protein HKCCE4037_11640 [Rhodobacterales bacterium HKCCE4037]|nr:hypothetical protein [Rhodobacterales bacterium HKCCE4037]
MAQATFLLNSGRVSSQQIYFTTQESGFGGVIEHEPMGAKPRPRFNMRNEEATDRMIASYKRVTPVIHRIDDCIATGTPYVNVGWTSFAMAPAFERRWGDNARFLALMRNPYSFSASLLTHRYFLDRNDLYQRAAIIHPDANIHYTALAARHDEFNPFEKCVFHWLELNRFILDFCKPRRIRIWKFEDLYGPGGTWKSFYKALSGITVKALSARRDDHQRALTDYEAFNVRPALAEPCMELCEEAGYSKACLDGFEATLHDLREKYARLRA